VNPNRIREATVVVAEKIRRGEVADAANALVGDDLEAWIEDLAVATIERDTQRIKRGMREASRRGASIQLELPGLEHAALPPVIWIRDEAGADVALPVWLATVAQIRREVSLNRRTVDLQSRVVAGWEATLAQLEKLGVPDGMTGGEIADRYAPQLTEAGDGA
jgi:hypothetical protein